MENSPKKSKPTQEMTSSLKITVSHASSHLVISIGPENSSTPRHIVQDIIALRKAPSRRDRSANRPLSQRLGTSAAILARKTVVEKILVMMPPASRLSKVVFRRTEIPRKRNLKMSPIPSIYTPI